MHLDFGLQVVMGRIPSDKPLSHMSSALQTAVTWMLGRGVNRIDVECSRNRNDLILNVGTTDKVSETLLYSPVSPLGLMEESGDLPKRLTDRLALEDETTVISSERLNPEMSVALLSYGTGDIITGLSYVFGATLFQWRLSMALTQMRINVGLSPDQLDAYFKDGQADYLPSTRISDLPLFRS